MYSISVVEWYVLVVMCGFVTMTLEINQRTTARMNTNSVFWCSQWLLHSFDWLPCVYVWMYTVEVWVVLTPTTDPTQEVKLLTGRKLPPLLSRTNYTAEGISHDHSKLVTHWRAQNTNLLPTKQNSEESVFQSAVRSRCCGWLLMGLEMSYS